MTSSLTRWLLLSILIAGCAGLHQSPRDEALRTGPLLAAAGFQIVPVTTEGRANLLKELPPFTIFYQDTVGLLRAVVPVGEGDADDTTMTMTQRPLTRYWFADPAVCHCLYVGDEEAYGKYEKLKVARELAADRDVSTPEAAAIVDALISPGW